VSAPSKDRAPKPLAPTLVNTATCGDERLLSEFAYSVKAWMTHMSPEARAKALAMVQAKVQEAKR
jgi:hypothetical protein